MTRKVAATALLLTLLGTVSFAQNAEVRQRVREWVSAWSDLEPEAKQELAESWRRAIENYRGLPPERQEEWKQAARDLVDFLQNLTPEQRMKARQFFAKMRETFGTLSHEQKQDLIRALTAQIQRVQSLTPEQKEKLREGWERWIERSRARRRKN